MYVLMVKAAVAWRAGESLVMEQVEVSPPEAMEIRIKVVSTSLCRSDVTAWQSHVHTLLPPFLLFLSLYFYFFDVIY